MKLKIPRGVDIIIWKGNEIGEFSYGDIVKVQPKGWNKYFIIPAQEFILHVKNLRYDNDTKFGFTKECRDKEGNIIASRRYALKMDKLQKKIERAIERKESCVVIRSWRRLLIDKEK